MNFYSVEINSGLRKEIKCLNDDLALKQAASMIRRWNQPKATVFRTNPYNASQKREIGRIINPEHNPELPVLTDDPIKEMLLSLHNAKKPKRRKRKAPGEGSPKGSTGSRATFEVPLAAIAEKMKEDPAALRRRLRKSNIPKPKGGWGWDSWDAPEVKEILSWGE